MSAGKDKRRAARIQGGSQRSTPLPRGRKQNVFDEKEKAQKKNECHQQVNPDDNLSVSRDEGAGGHKYEYVEPSNATKKACPPPVKKYLNNETLTGEIISQTDKNGQSIIRYFPDFLTTTEADEAFADLFEIIKWNVAYGKNRSGLFQMPRLMAWYGPIPYSFSGSTLQPEDAKFPKWIQQIHDLACAKLELDEGFNSVLINLYRNNHDSVDWHSDDENLFGDKPLIASVSLGTTRTFELRQHPADRGESHEFTQHIEIPLVHGSLLTMEGATQLDWQHRLRKEYHDKGERINLTFRRCIVTSEINEN